MARKAALAALVFCLLASILGGCSKNPYETVAEELYRPLVRIEIRSAETKELLKTIEEAEVIQEFQQYAFLSESPAEPAQSNADYETELFKQLGSAKPLYTFIEYRPIEKDGSTLRRASEFTVYEGTRIIQSEYPPTTVNARALPPEWERYYHKAAQEATDYLTALAQEQ